MTQPSCPNPLPNHTFLSSTIQTQQAKPGGNFHETLKPRVILPFPQRRTNPPLPISAHSLTTAPHLSNSSSSPTQRASSHQNPLCTSPHFGVIIPPIYPTNLPNLLLTFPCTYKQNYISSLCPPMNTPSHRFSRSETFPPAPRVKSGQVRSGQVTATRQRKKKPAVC